MRDAFRDPLPPDPYAAPVCRCDKCNGLIYAGDDVLLMGRLVEYSTLRFCSSCVRDAIKEVWPDDE